MGDGREADLRVGDIERGQARAMLDIHLGHGRLDAAEHEDRVSRAEAARTRGDIEALFHDLPAPRPDLTEATEVAPARPAGEVESRRSDLGNRIGGVWVATVLPAAILLTIFTGAWWMFIVFGVGLMIIGGATESAKKAQPPS